MNSGGFSDEQWDAWNDRLGEAYDRVLALPMTSENAALRAKALIALHSGEDIADMYPPNSTSSRLIVQIAKSLAAQHPPGRCNQPGQIAFLRLTPKQHCGS